MGRGDLPSKKSSGSDTFHHLAGASDLSVDAIPKAYHNSNQNIRNCRPHNNNSLNRLPILRHRTPSRSQVSQTEIAMAPTQLPENGNPL